MDQTYIYQEPSNFFISVIIPAHNEEDYISECLTSLKEQNFPSELYEIIVVDNNSKDRTMEIAQSFGASVIEKRDGKVGSVRNTGVQHSKGSILAFIDADCIAPKNWLSEGSKLLLSESAVFGGGCTLRAKPSWVEKAWLLENKCPPRELLGCSIFIRKTDFLDVGMFDETISSSEDTKLSISLRKKGYAVIMSDGLSVVHLGNPTSLNEQRLAHPT